MNLWRGRTEIQAASEKAKVKRERKSEEKQKDLDASCPTRAITENQNIKAPLKTKNISRLSFVVPKGFTYYIVTRWLVPALCTGICSTVLYVLFAQLQPNIGGSGASFLLL